MPQILVRKTIQIKKEPHKISPYIGDFHQWIKWSPWLLLDPKASIKVDASGHYYAWESPILGAGEMHLLHQENHEFICSLEFFKPWRSKAQVCFYLNPLHNGTLVVWTMKTNVPLYLFWMKRQIKLGVELDYERGLQLLKSLIETGTTESKLYIKGLVKTEETPYIGLSEIENRFVLEKLIAHPKMKPYGYKILHFHSKDNRGIDVALLYRESLFTVAAVKTYPLWLSHPKRQVRSPSRDQLVVTGYWGELELGILVNHWPSRRGGIKFSEPARIKAAQLQQKILDSLQRTNPESYLVSMGDFNDNPTNQSLRLLSQKSSYFEYFKPLYNPMLKLFKKGIGSLAYRDRWFLFDQILVSSNWLTQNGGVLLKPAVFNPKFLTTPEGKYIGYPYRTQITGTLLFGYSDHYPVYIVIGKE
jgi:hypothetical protein